MENNPISLDDSPPSIQEPEVKTDSSRSMAKPAREKEDVTPVEKATIEKLKGQTPTPAVTFEVNTNTGQVFIHVVDIDTGELIREIPPEELQKLASALENLSGKLFNTSA